MIGIPMIETIIDKEHHSHFFKIDVFTSWWMTIPSIVPIICKWVKFYLTVSPLNKNESQNSNKNSGERWDVDALDGMTRSSPTLPECLKCTVVGFEKWIVQVGRCVYCAVPTVLIETLLALIPNRNLCPFFGTLKCCTSEANRPNGTISLWLHISLNSKMPHSRGDAIFNKRCHFFRRIL